MFFVVVQRLPYGAVDFERLEGVDGIYVANFLDAEGRGRPQTVLSTDKGLTCSPPGRQSAIEF